MLAWSFLNKSRATICALILLQIAPPVLGDSAQLVGYKIDMARNGAVVMRGYSNCSGTIDWTPVDVESPPDTADVWSYAELGPVEIVDGKSLQLTLLPIQYSEFSSHLP